MTMSSRRIVYAVVLGIGAGAIAITAAPATIPTRVPLSHPLLQAPTPAVAGGSPAFDVVSVKRNPEPGTNYPLSPPVGGRLALRNQTVTSLISSSSGFQDYQIIGGPAGCGPTDSISTLGSKPRRPRRHRRCCCGSGPCLRIASTWSCTTNSASSRSTDW
jgi:hypothetical protein